jgi:hypothetical protein
MPLNLLLNDKDFSTLSVRFGRESFCLYRLEQHRKKKKAAISGSLSYDGNCS